MWVYENENMVFWGGLFLDIGGFYFTMYKCSMNDSVKFSFTAA